MDAEEFEKAEDIFKEVVKLDRNRSEAYAYLGILCQKGIMYRDQGPNKDRVCEFGLWSFDQAILRETDPSRKADYWWKRGVLLGCLGRNNERDASWQEADKILPGFTEKRNAKSEWMIRRTCEDCGNSFSLSDHGGWGAWIAAEVLEKKRLKFDDRGDFLDTIFCPSCRKKEVRNIILRWATRCERRWNPMQNERETKDN